MNDLQIIMNNIDSYRQEQGYTIKEFVDGITSERNYRRYLYEEQTVPFAMFSQFVAKLDRGLEDFFTSMHEQSKVKNIEVLYAFSLCVQGKFQQSDTYLDIVKKENKSLLGYSELINLIDLTNKYEASKITHEIYVTRLKEIYDINRLLATTIITKHQIYALGIFTRYLDDDIKYQVAKLFLCFLKEDDYEVITHDMKNASIILIEKGLEIISLISSTTIDITTLTKAYIPHLFQFLDLDHYVTHLSFVESLHLILTLLHKETKETSYYFYVLKMMNEGRFISDDDLATYDIDIYFNVLRKSQSVRPFKQFCKEIYDELK